MCMRYNDITMKKKTIRRNGRVVRQNRPGWKHVNGEWVKTKEKVKQ